MIPRAQHALDESSACRELFAELATELGIDPSLAPPVDEFPWAVIDPTTEDIIGAGDSPDEALADALATVRGWSK